MPPPSSTGPYLVFGASNTGAGTTWGAVVLETTDFVNFTLPASYSRPVLISPVLFGNCNPTYETTFDQGYAAPGSVVQDPTLPPGNLIMLYEAEKHCPGGAYQFPFYGTVGFARSSDNGKTWPAPVAGESGGPSRHPVLQSSDPQPTGPHTYLGDAIPSGFVDQNANNEYYLYISYMHFFVSAPGDFSPQIGVARAKLGADPLNFQKWYNGAFSQPGIGGLESEVLPSACDGRSQYHSEISYNDDLGLYLLIFSCQPGMAGSTGRAWYYSTATSLDLQNWTAPQMILNTQYPVTACPDGNGGSFDGYYPFTVSPGAAAGHTRLTGYFFFLSGCGDPGNRQFVSRTFTIEAEPTLPSPTSAVPAAGSGTAGTFTFTFSDTGGFASLNVLDVLINSALDGRKACYVAFVPSGPNSGSVYLVDDAGDAGGPYSGMTLPGSQSVSNSQCTITGAGSSVSVAQAFLPVSPNSVTLTLAVTFAPGFAGNQVIYMSAQDASSNSGWQALGTWNVPGPTPAGPWVSGMSPGHATNSSQTYKFTFTDTNGWQDISVANILVNSAIDGRQACYVAFVPSGAASGVVDLVDDAGDAGGPYSGMVLPGSGNVSNDQCLIGGNGSSVSASGNTLTLTLAIIFTPSFAGNQVFFLAARNNNGQNSNWQAVGTVAVP